MLRPGQVVTYDVTGDDGTRDVLVCWRPAAAAGLAAAPGEEVTARLRTLGGQHVERVARGVYMVVQTGLILRCNHPQAP